jgi:hypothetical protein
LLALYGSLTPLLRPGDQLVIKVCAGPEAIGFAMLPEFLVVRAELRVS